MQIRKPILYIFMIIAGVFWFFPMIWMVIQSFKPHQLIYTATPTWFFQPILDNYSKLFTPKYNFQHTLSNSLIIAGSSTVLVAILGAMAAYALSRYNFKGKAGIAGFILSVRFIPVVVVVVPIFQLFTMMQMTDNHLGMIFMYVVLELPLDTWLMLSFLNEIPSEIDEAAHVDGYSTLATFFRFILPLALPGLAVVATFTFMFSWNEFLLALILTRRIALTAPVKLMTFRSSGSFVMWGEVYAASTILVIPPTIAFLLMQRWLVKGLTLGAVK